MALSYSDNYTERELRMLETRIKQVYSQANKEVEATLKDYLSKFEKRDEEMKALLDAGEITEDKYKAWRIAQMGRGERWNTMKEQIADRLTNANQVASAYINDTTPGIYSLNHNYSCYEIEGMVDGVSFTLVDEQTVKNLLTDDRQILPYTASAINVDKDHTWNQRRLQNQLVSGIIQGKSIDKMAASFMSVTNMNYNSAVRNARTAVTGAQNAGRNESYKQATAMGIDLQKEWIATEDERTRQSHRELDGVRVANDDKFPNGLRFPGDSHGRPEEVYNCRCTMRAVLPKYKSADAHVTGKTVETYKQWEQNRIKSQNVNSKVTTNDLNTILNVFGTDQLKSTLGNDFVVGMNRIINSCDKTVKGVYYKYRDGLKCTEAHKTGRGAYFSPTTKGIHINVDNVSVGDSLHKPYQTAFHEFGHNLDYLANPRKDLPSYLSVQYKDGALYKAMQADYKALVKEAEAMNPALKKGSAVRWMLQLDWKDLSTAGNVSDALECMSGIAYPLGAGHGTTYWKKWGKQKGGPIEFFAEWFDAKTCNPEADAYTKKCFPKAYAVMEEIAKSMIGG